MNLPLAQFILQCVVFAIIGIGVFGLSRLLRCQPLDPGLKDPKRSGTRALLAVGISMGLIFLLILRQRILHGPASGSVPHIKGLKDLAVQSIVLALYVVPAAIFMVRNREPLRSSGISRVNLWQATLIGLGLAFFTFYLQPGGFTARIGRLDSHAYIMLVFYSFVGFGEEFLFRGYLQTRLIAWLGNWQGWVLASVIMAMVHLPHRALIEGQDRADALIASASLLPVSLLMGYVMKATGNVVASGLFHTFANWVNELK